MKRGTTKYWIDTWASNNHVEAHLRWETLLLHANTKRKRTNLLVEACDVGDGGSSRMCERQTKGCDVRHNQLTIRSTPAYVHEYAARLYDSAGFGLELLPRFWGCWYNPGICRLFVSLWALAFWIDLPRTSWFKKSTKSLTV